MLPEPLCSRSTTQSWFVHPTHDFTHSHTEARALGCSGGTFQMWVSEWVSICVSISNPRVWRHCVPLPFPLGVLQPLWLTINSFLCGICSHSKGRTQAELCSCAFAWGWIEAFCEGVMLSVDCSLMHLVATEIFKGWLLFLMVLWQSCQLNKPLWIHNVSFLNSCVFHCYDKSLFSAEILNIFIFSGDTRGIAESSAGSALICLIKCQSEHIFHLHRMKNKTFSVAAALSQSERAKIGFVSQPNWTVRPSTAVGGN